MPRISEEIASFISTFKVRDGETWEAHGNRVVRHFALERIGEEQDCVLIDLILIAADQDKGTAIVKAVVKRGERLYQSFGEASPKNNKNTHPVNMAEKRAIDRALLKALRVHGQVYSDAEADDFAQPKPEKNTFVKTSVNWARMEHLIKEMGTISDAGMLFDWGKVTEVEVRGWPQSDKDRLNEAFAKRSATLKGKTA